MHQTFNLFPSVVKKTRINKDLIEEINCFQNSSTEFYYNDILTDPTFEKIKNEVAKIAQEICPNTRRIDNWKIVSGWINNQPRNSKGFGFHGHVDSFMSAVVYLQGEDMSISFRDTPKESSVVNPNPSDFDIIVRHTWHKDVSIPVEVGDLVFFPSYLLHRPNHNLTDQSRVSLAYNLLPSRKILPDKRPWSMDFNL